MQPSKKALEEFKGIYKKKTGKELSDQEAYEMANNLLNFVELLYECARKEAIKKRKLKEHPGGFHLEDGIYNCLICHRQVTGKESWYDELGPKCLICQKAINKGVVPKYVCKNRDSWYAMWELKSEFDINPATANKMMREGKLKARIIQDEAGRDYFYVFLVKENKGLSGRKK
ncbi:MAG: hypothetical protein WC650_04175 [Candidatus Doudnabacteria bacterium]